jgi:pyruvate dehydrogenase E2 component (dihydrolipoamide acetyltransferase)
MADFKLPEIGEGVIEGEIVAWLKQPGEAIAANEALVEVMTDKATIEIPSPLAGVMVEHVAAPGEICEVGAVIARIDESGDAGASAPAPAPASTPAPRGSTASVPATPAARALARSEGIDLGEVPIDDRGRITKADILAHRDRAADQAAVAPTPSSTPTAIPVDRPVSAPAPTPTAMAATAPVASAPAKPAPAARRGSVVDREDEYQPFRGLRRKIAEQMARSYSTAVHYTYVEQIDVTKLVKLRKEAKAAAAEQGVSLSFLPFIIKAVCHALRRYPIVNAELDEANARVIVKKRYHIGVATATDRGLMVPVIRDADALSLLDIAREIVRLANGARDGTASRDELGGSTFSITSLGTIGGVLATPIINYPEVGILGVHAIRKAAVVGPNDEISVGHLMNLSVSLDHRVVDGFEGANFLQEVRRYLEDPNLLLLASI